MPDPYDIYLCSPAVVGGTVYIGSGDQQVCARDAATGKELWRYTTGNDTTIYNQIGIASSAAVAECCPRRWWLAAWSTSGARTSISTPSGSPARWPSAQGLGGSARATRRAVRRERPKAPCCP
jgi:outer membrane protein assembly factor BamB